MTILNLQKNDILNLTKRDPELQRIDLAAGWDVVERYIEKVEPRKVGGFFGIGARTEHVVVREEIKNKYDYDLDLSALLLDKEERVVDFVYFREKCKLGVRLHEDNLTGRGEGDDETISIDLNMLPNYIAKIIVAVNIYDAHNREQSFGQVKNAFVRLINRDTNMEICRYNLTEDGGENTCLEFAQLERVNGEWNFKALGNLNRKNLHELVRSYR